MQKILINNQQLKNYNRINVIIIYILTLDRTKESIGIFPLILNSLCTIPINFCTSIFLINFLFTSLKFESSGQINFTVITFDDNCVFVFNAVASNRPYSKKYVN
jgi:hypothetical protein